MSTELRESGIGPVGWVPWGTHFCYFYETKEDLLDILIPYFKAGLKSNELCIWIVSEPLSLEEAKSALRKAVPEFDRFLAEGSIELIPHSEWFFEGSTLDLPGAINRFTEELNQALARGYAGLRVNGSTTWLDDRGEGLLYEFEKELDSFIDNQLMIVSCAFQLARSGAGQLLDAARTHQFALARRRGNWEIVEIPELKQSKEEIRSLNKELEQRVAERTRELEVANEELRREIAERKEVDEQLSRQKELLQKIFDHIPVMINLLDKDGRVTLVNREWGRVLGWSPEEVMEKGAAILAEAYPDLQQRQQALNLISTSHEEWVDFKTRVRDGRVIDTSWVVGHLSDGTGIVFGIDITERKQVENKLGERVKELTALHAISRALQQEWPGTKVLLGKLTSLLPLAFQHPEITAVRLRIGQATVETPGFSESSPVLQADFTTIDGQPGSVQVIYTEDRPRGVDGLFLSEEQALINTVADMLCTAYNRKQVEDAEREQRVLAEALRDTAAALNSTLDFEKVLDRILENVGLVVPHETAVIMLLENGYWRAERHKGFTERGLKEWLDGLQVTTAERPLYGRVVKTAEPLLVPDSRSEPEWVSSPADWIRSLIIAPISIKGEVIGLLILHSSSQNFFTHSHAARLQAFADQAAIALANAELVREGQAGRERLQTLSQQLLVAQEDERRAIARELHDEIGQVLTAVGANLQVIELSPHPTTRAERLEESINLVNNALRQVRDLSLDLRPSLLDDFGLVPALEWYLERQAHRSGFSAEIVANPPEMRLPPNLETTCFRVVQIALTNVTRHADAKNVHVELRRHGTELDLVIRDDGVGFDVETALERASRGATLGLLSMQERVRLAHGNVEIKSAPGHGTEIDARFPLD